MLTADLEAPIPSVSDNSGGAAQLVVPAKHGVVFGFFRRQSIRWIFGRLILDQNGVVCIYHPARDPLTKHVGSYA